jgi:hypothetical protein
MLAPVQLADVAAGEVCQGRNQDSQARLSTYKIKYQ